MAIPGEKVIHDGAVTLHGRSGGDAPALVPGAAVHLDASAPDAFEFDGAGKVRTWRAMPGTAISAAAVSLEAVAAPTVVTDAATGKPVVDFGAYAANAAAQQGTSAALGLSETLRNVRELFIVFRDKSPEGIRPGAIDRLPLDDRYDLAFTDAISGLDAQAGEGA